MAVVRVTQFLARLLTTAQLASAVDEELSNIASNAVGRDELGVSGKFTSADTPAKIVTVTKGIITKIE